MHLPESDERGLLQRIRHLRLQEGGDGGHILRFALAIASEQVERGGALGDGRVCFLGEAPGAGQQPGQGGGGTLELVQRAVVLLQLGEQLGKGADLPGGMTVTGRGGLGQLADHGGDFGGGLATGHEQDQVAGEAFERAQIGSGFEKSGQDCSRVQGGRAHHGGQDVALVGIPQGDPGQRSGGSGIVELTQAQGQLETDAQGVVFDPGEQRLDELGGRGGAQAGFTDPDGMLIAILDPNRAVEDRYLNYVAQTKAGDEISGILVGETANSITLVGASGNRETVLRTDLKSLISTRLSLMPEGFEQLLKPQDIADLIAYIEAGALPPRRFAGNQPALVKLEPTRALRLRAANAEIYGEGIAFETPYANLGSWNGQNARAVWTLDVPAAGAYEVWVHWACNDTEAGHAFRLQV